MCEILACSGKLKTRVHLAGDECFSSLLGASRACADFRESTEDSRLKAYLSNAGGERYYIGDLITSKKGKNSELAFTLADEQFGNYFLSMRPFRCLEVGAQVLCYLPYPYQKPASFSAVEMRPLEYDFMFIHRSAADYGIGPWNGQYYKLAWKHGKLQGQALAVDLNILASPPEAGEVFPLGEADLHSLDPAQVWLPTLEFEEVSP